MSQPLNLVIFLFYSDYENGKYNFELLTKNQNIIRWECSLADKSNAINAIFNLLDYMARSVYIFIIIII